MTFTPKVWKNGPSGGTPLSAAALIDVEERLSSYSSEALTFKTVASSGTALTINLSEATVWRITLTGNCVFTFPTPEAGKGFILVLTQDGTGGRVVTWPGTTRWSNGVYPTLSGAIAAIDIIYFECLDGEHWAGFPGGYGMAAGGGSATVPQVVQDAITVEKNRAEAAEATKAASNDSRFSSIPTILCMTADFNATKENTTPQSLTELTTAITASSTEIWLFKYWLDMKAANATMDAKFEFAGLPASSSVRWGGLAGVNSSVRGYGLSATANSPLALNETGGLTSLTMGSVEGIFGVTLITKVFGGGTAGNITLKVSQSTSDAGQLSVLKGSYLEALKVRA